LLPCRATLPSPLSAADTPAALVSIFPYLPPEPLLHGRRPPSFPRRRLASPAPPHRPTSYASMRSAPCTAPHPSPSGNRRSHRTTTIDCAAGAHCCLHALPLPSLRAI
jgi:hypothetical protein